MATILRANGTSEEIDTTEVTLEKLQQAVGGYIERIVCRDYIILYVNNEARLTGLPYNNTASALANMTILGDAVSMTRVEDIKWNLMEKKDA